MYTHFLLHLGYIESVFLPHIGQAQNPLVKQPGNNIDVYLEPLVNELKLTWDEGARTYNAHSRSFFNMKAILMWVIHEFQLMEIWLVAQLKGLVHALYVEKTQIQCISNIVGSVCTWDIGYIFQ